MSPTTRLQARATWEFLDFLANSLLFLLVGLALRPIGEATLAGLGTRALWPLVVAIVAMTVARAVVVWVVTAVQGRTRRALPRRWRPVLTWAGLRGAVSLAAGLSLPATLAGRPLLLAMTFGTVLFTLLAQGLTIRPLMAHLGLGGDGASRFDFELAVGPPPRRRGRGARARRAAPRRRRRRAPGAAASPTIRSAARPVAGGARHDVPQQRSTERARGA